MKQETTVERRKRQTYVFSAKEKSQAVLSLWSGRRSASGLMRELKVPWATISGWEKRALSGILTALDPKWKEPAAGAQSLPARVERLMERAFRPRTETATVVEN
mgnify:CR=1 FL=1